ncbi:unnamed protein product [Ostreobium quekettii]|uniref:Uncharacterized protein n=1 Tax=Ostreobium quekettii TaxID=121088 RepID=A0A8S1J8Q4_9CHLO|nr:unnamed protein product [Ostreobium quekettii]
MVTAVYQSLQVGHEHRTEGWTCVSLLEYGLPPEQKRGWEGDVVWKASDAVCWDLTDRVDEIEPDCWDVCLTEGAVFSQGPWPACAIACYILVDSVGMFAKGMVVYRILALGTCCCRVYLALQNSSQGFGHA